MNGGLGDGLRGRSCAERKWAAPGDYSRSIGVNEQVPQPQDSPSSCLSLLKSPLLRSKGVPKGQLTFSLEGRASQAGANTTHSG